MEIEVKYSLPDDQTLHQIASAERINGLHVGELRDKLVDDRYMDTADLRFYKAGYVCRVRTSGGKSLITLKSLAGGSGGALHQREELETDATGDQPSEWAEGDARTLGEKIAGDAPLSELFRLSQIRRVGYLYDGSRKVVELSLDRVRVEGASRSEQYDELEAELRDGSNADMEQLAAFLEAEYHLIPQPLSKFERALKILRPDLVGAVTQKLEKKKGPGIAPHDSMHTAARKSIAHNLPKMISKEEGTLSGDDPEDLHDMRVATRRMRGAARIFGPYFEDTTILKLGRGLRDVAAALGAVRDLDVQLEQARAFRATLPEKQQPGFDRLLENWQHEREAARLSMRQHLESAEYAKLKKRLQKFATTEEEEFDWTGVAEVIPYQVRHRAGSDIWDHYEDVWAFDVVAQNPSEPQMHHVRITCKYLRYTLEFFEEVLPAGATAMIGRLAGVQDTLGSFHDAAVSIERLQTYIANATTGKKRDAKNLAGAQSYLLERQTKLATMRQEFPALWAQLAGHDFRSQLAGLIAGIGGED